MANELTLTNRFGNVILTCAVNINIEIDADQANADVINAALAADNLMTIAVSGNSVPTTANTTLMYSTLLFQQIDPQTMDPQTGTITINII
jgi:hypothetical protein